MARNLLLSLAIGSSLLGAAHRAHADGNDVDVTSFEYIDVVETSDGSIWKGVVIEQQPNVRYKIATADGSLHVIQAGDVVKVTKAKNPAYHGVSHAAQQPPSLQVQAASAPSGQVVAAPPQGDGNGVAAQIDQPEPDGPARPLTTSGLRIDAELLSVVPMGTLADSMTGESQGIGARFGYEIMLGKLGITAGEQTRLTYWSLAGDQNNAAWTLEALAYARASLHLGRVAPYAQVAVGLDTNYQFNAMVNMSNTSFGLGIDAGTGLTIVATPRLAFDLGVDYHPGTDNLNSQSPVGISAEYLAFHAGASIRL
jgi:hypothetical protein